MFNCFFILVLNFCAAWLQLSEMVICHFCSGGFSFVHAQAIKLPSICCAHIVMHIQVHSSQKLEKIWSFWSLSFCDEVIIKKCVHVNYENKFMTRKILFWLPDSWISLQTTNCSSMDLDQFGLKARRLTTSVYIQDPLWLLQTLLIKNIMHWTKKYNSNSN